MVLAVTFPDVFDDSGVYADVGGDSPAAAPPLRFGAGTYRYWYRDRRMNLPELHPTAKEPCDVCGIERRAKATITCPHCGRRVCVVCQVNQRNADRAKVGHELAEHGNELRRVS